MILDNTIPGGVGFRKMSRYTKKKETIKRLKIIEGHLKKVREMVEKNIYCIDILQQSLAVQSALRKVDGIILDSHLHTCVTKAIGEKKEEKIEEILELFKKRR